MRKILFAAAALALVSGSAAPSFAAPCKDAKGKFTKCPPAAAVAAKPAVTKDAKGKCHFASGPNKGKFTKC
jgi:hypothetical protein